ncbi:Scr1 family TA system antitoxin-like transcriptional regulator, partial [Nocardia sp. NPDC003354]
APLAAACPPAENGTFSILRFGDADLPDIVYIEQLTSAIYLDKRDDLEFYAEAMERLCVEAAPPERTRELLARLRDELYPA